MSNPIVICSAVRTPIGRLGGGLATLLPLPMATLVIREAIAQARVDPALIGQTSMGWVLQDPRSPNIAKTAAERAGVPSTSPGTTLHENCASGAAAVHDVCRRLLLGEVDVAVAGGVESMSNVPRYLFATRGVTKSERLGDVTLVDGLLLGLTDSNIGPRGELMGLLTERLVKKYGLTREEQDAIAYRSHQNAVKAWDEGMFDYVLKVTPPSDSKEPAPAVTRDETPRASDLAVFAKQKPHFDKNGTITAMNSSALNDGAAAMVLSTQKFATERGLPILATIRGFTTVGVPPELMGEGAFKVLPKLLDRAKVAMKDVAHFELNEAFAAVVGAAAKDVPDLPMDKVNVWGSGISLGHPVGCTGSRQLTDMVHQLRKRGQKVGVTTRCVGGGMGSGEVIEIFEQ